MSSLWQGNIIYLSFIYMCAIPFLYFFFVLYGFKGQLVGVAS